MGLIIVVVLLLTSASVAMRRGPGAALAYVFLPVLLLLSKTAFVTLEPLPDLNSLSATTLGTLIGTLLGGHWPRLRFHWLDGLVIACSVSLALTAYLNGTTWTLIAGTGNDTLRYLMPYLMARVAFFDPDLRRHCAISLSWIAIVMGACALIEFRLRPLVVSRTLEDLGMSIVDNTMVLRRSVFFRAMVTTEHPIDLGNAGLILTGLIPMLAITGGVGLRDRRVLAGIGGAVGCVLFSMSFSSICGLAVAGGLYLGLRYVRGSEYLLVPGMCAAILAGFLFTQHMLNSDLDALRRDAANKNREAGTSQSAVDGSYITRVLIVQNAYNRIGVDAGYFGFGDHTLTKKDLGLLSVDNSYMLFLLRRGWSGLTLRLVLGVGIALLGTQLLIGARGESARAPAAAAVAVLIGTMAAMYTVWFGFVYAVLWTVTLAMTVSMRQVLVERRRAMAFAQYDGRGFAVAPPVAMPPAGAMPPQAGAMPASGPLPPTGARPIFH